VAEFRLQTAAFSGVQSPAKSHATDRAAKAAARSTGKTAKAVSATRAKVAKPAKVPKGAKKVSASKRAHVAPDVVQAVGEGAETVQIQVEVKAAGQLIVSVMAADGEYWRPVADDLLRHGLELLLKRESRLERTAARYGVEAEALLASLEQSVVDVTDESAGIPEAELNALREAGIKLRGSETDPSGAAQVALGLSRSRQFRDEALTAAQAARKLGVTDGRVRQLVAANSVVTIPNGDGYLLPAWQIVAGRLLPGLDGVMEVAGDVHPLTLAGFMTRPDVDLEIEGQPATPVQWLLAGGDSERVADLAAGLSLPA